MSHQTPNTWRRRQWRTRPQAMQEERESGDQRHTRASIGTEGMAISWRSPVHSLNSTIMRWNVRHAAIVPSPTREGDTSKSAHLALQRVNRHACLRRATR